MYKVVTSSRFKKDYKLCQKRRLPIEQLDQVIVRLARGENLEERFKNHTLTGKYKGYEECHIQPDWLFVYEYRKDELFLYRTGTHSDLFN
ncbi:MAG: type II toxin-antitoxin system YafQ family toxin [Staphylococcus equorum]|nr:type II toxin-antitoxin system YafQ family toxin [Staphylococcus equorum]